MTKVRRKSTKQLSAKVERTRLLLEQELLESQIDALNFVDPRDAYRDESGEEWDEIGASGGYLEEAVEPFRNEHELARIRQRARRTVQRNAYAQNFLTNLVSFVVGKGHTYKVIPIQDDDGQDVGAHQELVKSLQDYVDDLLKMNKWKKRQKEIYHRTHRDGEAFLRLFPQEDGFVKIRFVEPYEVSTPKEFHSEENSTYGIKTDPDDVETVESYYVGDEEVPYFEMQHRKTNVDMNVKRGLSSIWCVLASLDRGMNLLRNMSTVVATQASIALIRKHDTTSSNVKSFVNNSASHQSYIESTGETRNFKRMRPGTILDAKAGTEYEFPAVGLNPAAPVEVLGAECRAIASSKSLPEYMVGSDSSNANYSSSMISESPAVRFFEGEQEDTIEADLELIYMAIDHAIDTGRLRPEVKTQLKIMVTAPVLVTRDPKAVAEENQIYMNARVKSPQTVQGQLGLKSDEELANWREFDDRMYPEMQIDPLAGEDPQQQTDDEEGDPKREPLPAKNIGRTGKHKGSPPTDRKSQQKGKARTTISISKKTTRVA